MRIKEQTLILPALYIIEQETGTTMSVLIRELNAFFNPTGEDATILEGRKDTKFSQKVRNLKSHRDNNGMRIYTTLKDGRYKLTAEGHDYLNANREQIEYLFSNKYSYDELIQAIDSIEKATNKKHKVYVYTEQDMITEGNRFLTINNVRKRSQSLRQAAIEHYKQQNGKIYCDVCGFCFEEAYGDIGKDFIEIHHIKPLYQYSNEGFKAYIPEAIEKVRPLCANCHRMIHRNPKRPMSIEELKDKMIRAKC